MDIHEALIIHQAQIENIKIPKKTSLVYIIGNTGYSNQVKLPALKAIGHRIEILRNMRYLYNIKVANSSLYQINKMKNSTFIMEPNVSKVDCHQHDEIGNYICTKILHSGARDFVDNKNDYWN